MTTTGTEFMVGGDFLGWDIFTNYTDWAQDKVFHVGDKLVFSYIISFHNVFTVNGSEFDNCTVPPINEALTSGYDIVTLTSPGPKWYICGVDDHCSLFNQKLAINVEKKLGKSSSHGTSAFMSGYLALVSMVVALAIVLV
ncbi:blue copper protein 1b-like [Impatiens glandulifera]|uniref:blue copper protein 1b-like n=1 Tax=Impatiens glandulifera TaxID=253017 RepID=UPI001FB14144|nr:blue copper protein 1b-like [Impatiens glandulifera]